jgi:predicted porin
VGTIGGWGPTTSIIGRRETTASAPSSNCQGIFQGGTNLTSGGVGTTSLCYHAEGPAAPYPTWRRYGSAAFYDSPVFSGFQFRLGYQPNETKSTVTGTTDNAGNPFLGTTTKTLVAENPSSWSASLTWTGMGGKARAFVANMQAKDWTSVGQTDGGWTAGGGYDFGVVNVGGTYETYKYKSATATTEAVQMAVGIAIPLGSGKIGASYAVADELETGGTAVTNSGAKMYNLGYEWALSKRTALGFGYAKIDNDSAAAFTWTGMAPNQNGVSITAYPGSDVENLFVSIRHSF